jgi:hypothetical protein
MRSLKGEEVSSCLERNSRRCHTVIGVRGAAIMLQRQEWLYQLLRGAQIVLAWDTLAKDDWNVIRLL